MGFYEKFNLIENELNYNSLVSHIKNNISQGVSY